MNSTESLVIGIMIVYTTIIIIGLNRYESIIKDLQGSISDYKRAYSLSKDVKTHYTQVQLDAISLRKSLYELDRDNELLKHQLAQARLELLQSRPIQYESSIHQASLFESQIDFE
jgi:hypothetical protein